MTAPLRLTAHESALIAAFEATQGVTICPPCTFSTDPTESLSWREIIRREQTAGKLAYLVKLRAEASRRRAKVAELARMGLPKAEIARRLGISVKTVRRDMQ